MSKKIITNLSDQAIGVLMVTLQKCIMEQSDITEILRGYEFKRVRNLEEKVDSLIITNPPTKITSTEL